MEYGVFLKAAKIAHSSPLFQLPQQYSMIGVIGSLERGNLQLRIAILISNKPMVSTNEA